MGNKPNIWRLGKCSFVSCKNIRQTLVKPKGDSPPITEDLRGKFYGHYRKEAEEYDGKFIKKHDEDPNTTLIFVCCAHRVGTRVLTSVIGRSVFCRNFRLHYLGQLRNPV